MDLVGTKRAGGVLADASNWRPIVERNTQVITLALSTYVREQMMEAKPMGEVFVSSQPVKIKVQTAAEKAVSIARGNHAAQGMAVAATQRAQQLAAQNDPGMVLQDVAQLSPAEAKGVLAMVQRMIDMSGAESWSISGANNGVGTRSLQTYADWLRDQAGTSVSVKA